MRFKIFNYEELVKLNNHARDNNRVHLPQTTIYNIDPTVTNLVTDSLLLGDGPWADMRFFTAYEGDPTPQLHSMHIRLEDFNQLREWEKPQDGAA
jgi:hypothetical protein